MSTKPIGPAPKADPARQRALEVLALVEQGVRKVEITWRLRVNGATIDRVKRVEAAGGVATIRIRRVPAKHLARQRQRIVLVHELAAEKKPISGAEIARTSWRLGKHRLPGHTHGAAADLWARRDLAAQQRVEQRQQRALLIRALQNEGMSRSAIAKRLGVSRWVVTNDLSDRPKKPWRRPELQERDRRARALYASGMKVPAIAVELGVSAGTIWRDLTTGYTSADLRRGIEVRRLVARGVNKLKIAKRLGVNPCVVYDVPAARYVPLPQRYGPRAKALRAQGLSISAIERELNLNRDTVKRALATSETLVHHRRPGKRSPERQRALKVVELRAAGIAKAEIARRLKMGAHTINRVIRLAAAGKPVAIRSRRQPDAKRVRKLFKQGLGKSAIARRLGTSRTTVHLLLGIERPPVPPDRAQLVRDLHAAGVIKTAIAKQARMSLTDVYRILPAPAPSSKRAAAPRPQRQRKPRAMTVRAVRQRTGASG